MNINWSLWFLIEWGKSYPNVLLWTIPTINLGVIQIIRDTLGPGVQHSVTWPFLLFKKTVISKVKCHKNAQKVSRIIWMAPYNYVLCIFTAFMKSILLLILCHQKKLFQLPWLVIVMSVANGESQSFSEVISNGYWWIVDKTNLTS